MINFFLYLKINELNLKTDENPLIFDMDKMSVIFKKLQGYALIDINQELKNIFDYCKKLKNEGIVS